jgi:cytochrome P450
MEAGSETTAAFMLNFTAALLSYPECQKKAQQEIDEVVGDRMPSPDDFSVEQMPYLNALIKEVCYFSAST